MPATRTIRRDVILRVPKIDAKATKPDASLADAREASGSDGARFGNSHVSRRSASPAKRVVSHPLPNGSRAAESTGDGDEGYQYAAQATSAAEWNSLLIWARRQRGPQWDAATGIWQVDQGSAEYYSFGNDPARHTKLSNAVDEELSGGDMNSKVTGEAGHTGGMDEGREGESSHGIGGYNVEDSPPIGPGGRRSRAR